MDSKNSYYNIVHHFHVQHFINISLICPLDNEIQIQCKFKCLSQSVIFKQNCLLSDLNKCNFTVFMYVPCIGMCA